MNSDREILLNKLAEKIRIKYPQYKVNVDIKIKYPQYKVNVDINVVASIGYEPYTYWFKTLIEFYIDDSGQLITTNEYDVHLQSYSLCEPDSLDKFFCDLDKFLKRKENQPTDPPDY